MLGGYKIPPLCFWLFETNFAGLNKEILVQLYQNHHNIPDKWEEEDGYDYIKEMRYLFNNGLERTIEFLNQKYKPKLRVKLLEIRDFIVLKCVMKHHNRNSKSKEDIDQLLQNMDKDAAEKITNEISNLYRQLDTEVDKRRADGNPMTQQQVIDLGNKLISEAPGIRDILDDEYANAITDATFQSLLSDIIRQAETVPQEKRPAEIIKLIDDMNEQGNVAENVKNASKSLRLQMLDLKNRYESLAR